MHTFHSRKSIQSIISRWSSKARYSLNSKISWLKILICAAERKSYFTKIRIKLFCQSQNISWNKMNFGSQLLCKKTFVRFDLGKSDLIILLNWSVILFKTMSIWKIIPNQICNLTGLFANINELIPSGA